MIDLYNSDNIDELEKLASNSIDHIITDPPYLYLNHTLDKPFDEERFFKECFRVLKKDGFLVLFGRGQSFYRWNTHIANLGFVFKEEIVWNKIESSSPALSIMRVHETISVHTKGKGSIKRVKIPYLEARSHDFSRILDDIKSLKIVIKNNSFLKDLEHFLSTGELNYIYGNKGSVTMQANSIKKEAVCVTVAKAIKHGMNERTIISETKTRHNRIHPTEKPVRLIERLILLVSNENDTILDPFAGSGSTGIACLNTNRRFIGYEIDQEYFSLAKKRIEDAKLKNEYTLDL